MACSLMSLDPKPLILNKSLRLASSAVSGSSLVVAHMMATGGLHGR